MAHPKRRQSSARQGKEGHTIMQNCLPWLYVPTVVHGTSTTPYVVNVVTKSKLAIEKEVTA